jgi:hypothetical protein
LNGDPLVFDGVRMEADNQNEPRGWLEGFGRVEIKDDSADIFLNA